MAAISAQQRRQFNEQGYFVLERALTQRQLSWLRSACARGIDSIHARMDAAGTDTIDISHRNTRYFVSNLHREDDALRQVVFDELFADICRATIGDTAFLFLEQFVVKAAEKGMKFGWHQDSAYLPLPHEPYVTCWVALDDVTERNGAISVMPYHRSGTNGAVPHRKESSTNDLIGYDGDDPGILVAVPAGSIVVFSSQLLHRSGPNLTATPRRAWLAQFSPHPILYEDGRPRQNAVPFLAGGLRLAE